MGCGGAARPRPCTVTYTREGAACGAAAPHGERGATVEESEARRPASEKNRRGGAYPRLGFDQARRYAHGEKQHEQWREEGVRWSIVRRKASALTEEGWRRLRTARVGAAMPLRVRDTWAGRRMACQVARHRPPLH
jgi:hypothetical protein